MRQGQVIALLRSHRLDVGKPEAAMPVDSGSLNAQDQTPFPSLTASHLAPAPYVLLAMYMQGLAFIKVELTTL